MKKELKTIVDLETATAQEVFDLVAGHLLWQNAKSENADACLYRGPNGLKCAAGFLLNDDVDFSLIENRAWEDAIVLLELSNRHENLISTLQMIHDQEDLKDWKERLSELAKDFKLNSEILEK